MRVIPLGGSSPPFRILSIASYGCLSGLKRNQFDHLKAYVKKKRSLLQRKEFMEYVRHQFDTAYSESAVILFLH